MKDDEALRKAFPARNEAQALGQLRLVKKVHAATRYMREAFPEVNDGYAKELASNRVAAKHLVKQIRGFRQS